MFLTFPVLIPPLKFSVVQMEVIILCACLQTLFLSLGGKEEKECQKGDDSCSKVCSESHCGKIIYDDATWENANCPTHSEFLFCEGHSLNVGLECDVNDNDQIFNFKTNGDEYCSCLLTCKGNNECCSNADILHENEDREYDRALYGCECGSPDYMVWSGNKYCRCSVICSRETFGHLPFNDCCETCEPPRKGKRNAALYPQQQDSCKDRCGYRLNQTIVGISNSSLCQCDEDCGQRGDTEAMLVD